MLRSTRLRDGLRERRQGWQREQRDDLAFSEARHILWERRWLVAGCTILFLAIALLYAFSKEPVYVAEATLFLKGTTLRAKDASKDVNHAINLIADEMAVQVKRHRDKRRGRREARSTLGSAEAPPLP